MASLQEATDDLVKGKAGGLSKVEQFVNRELDKVRTAATAEKLPEVQQNAATRVTELDEKLKVLEGC